MEKLKKFMQFVEEKGGSKDKPMSMDDYVKNNASHRSGVKEKPPVNGVYPDQPENTGKNLVLPYHSDEKDFGKVIVAEPYKDALGNKMTPGMDKASALGVKPDDKHVETLPAARKSFKEYVEKQMQGNGKILQVDGKDAGFGEKSSPGLSPEKNLPGGKKPTYNVEKVSHKKSSRKALKEFCETTKGMSDSEFVTFLMERKNNQRLPVSMVHDLNGEPFTPHPHEAISYICSLMHNPEMISRLVREAKRHGHLESLVSELMDHPEFYQEAVKMMDDEDGDKVTDKFARTMVDHEDKFRKEAGLDESRRSFRERLLNEKVSPPVSDDNDDEGEGDMEDMPSPEEGSETGGNPMADPEGLEEEPGQELEDEGPEDAEGNPADGSEMGLGDEEESHHKKHGKTHVRVKMARSMKNHMGDDRWNDTLKSCADGNC